MLNKLGILTTGSSNSLSTISCNSGSSLDGPDSSWSAFSSCLGGSGNNHLAWSFAYFSEVLDWMLGLLSKLRIVSTTETVIVQKTKLWAINIFIQSFDIIFFQKKEVFKSWDNHLAFVLKQCFGSISTDYYDFLCILKLPRFGNPYKIWNAGIRFVSIDLEFGELDIGSSTMASNTWFLSHMIGQSSHRFEFLNTRASCQLPGQPVKQ